MRYCAAYYLHRLSLQLHDAASMYTSFCVAAGPIFETRVPFIPSQPLNLSSCVVSTVRTDLTPLASTRNWRTFVRYRSRWQPLLRLTNTQRGKPASCRSPRISRRTSAVLCMSLDTDDPSKFVLSMHDALAGGLKSSLERTPLSTAFVQ